MYPHIDIELAKARMNRKKLAEKTGISYNTLLLKLAGKSIITLDEGFAIKKALKTSLSIENLFKKANCNKDGV